MLLLAFPGLLFGGRFGLGDWGRHRLLFDVLYFDCDLSLLVKVIALWDGRLLNWSLFEEFFLGVHFSLRQVLDSDGFCVNGELNGVSGWARSQVVLTGFEALLPGKHV